MHGFGCCPLQLTLPPRGAVSGSLVGADPPTSGGGNILAGNGFNPVFTEGAGITRPGSTG